MAAEEIRRLTELLKEKDAQLTEKDAQLLQLTQLKRYIIDKGFPPAAKDPDRGNSSTASINHHHDPASFCVSQFNRLIDLQLIPSTSCLVPRAARGSLGWATESDIQLLVNCAFVDLISIVGLSDQLQVLNEESSFAFRADITVIRLHDNVSIGVVEVKKPNTLNSSSALDDPVVAGQIFNYMVDLRETDGVRDVFGVVSTYTEWRICWLSDNDGCAAANKLEDIPDFIPQLNTDERVVHCTRIYPYNDPSLVVDLCSMLHKMYHNKVKPPSTLIDLQRKYKFVHTKTCKFRKLPEHLVLSYDHPHGSTNSFYLLQDYHGGADGRVWLGCSEKGNLVVIKFRKILVPDKLQEDNSLDEEVSMWKKVWGVKDCRKTTLYEIPALVMPFAFHIRSDRGMTFTKANHWSNELKTEHEDVSGEKEIGELLSVLDPQQIAKEALYEMTVKKGYRHDDLAWRHVAVLPRFDKKKWSLKPILIDLTHTSKVEKIERERVYQEQCSKLESQAKQIVSNNA